ncbi:uncharacterized protein LOC123874350 isoform X1 [Maniola jurtina]|uniref:uncharacterized protein LOC123874350 isoform X1 n=1 Tax=Maniola jurtina TaxID=191418 RepID=UPI001E68CF6F|nr:uncharacterized protein LOC123874350 isoform X1 [Maniola jurtina]
MYRYCVLLIFVCSYVICEDCVTVDFENGFEDFTSNHGVCLGLSPWDVIQYSSVDIDSPHVKSTRLITPQAGISCVSSFKFTVTAGGILEVNVYMISGSPFDHISARVFQSTVGTEDVLIGTAFHISNSYPDWETINMTIHGNGSFEGYVTFQSLALSTNTIIWIDSFRYIGPSSNKDSCVIYEEDQITTAKPTTTTTSTTEAPNEDCVIVDFESNFEEDFTNDYGICVGLFAWEVKNYSSVDIDSPHSRSARFIVPQQGLSCVSSFKFPMTTGGRLQVNLYMMSTSLVDQQTITVFQSIVGGNDITLSRAFLNNMSSEFVPGWQTINITVDGPERFEGYITFHGMSMSPNPIIWIDSFRYIGLSSDKDSCVIYEDESSTQAPTTTTTEAPSEDCVTEDFENNFEDNFTSNNTECTGFFTWDIKQYSSVDIDSPHPESTSFITPQPGVSCVSSFKFPMTTGGRLQVNLYMMSTSLVDQLTIIIYQSILGGNDITINRVFHSNMSSEFVPGWQTINMTIDGPARFEGYVTFNAISRSPNPIIWIDSFRYIGPSSDKDSCVIYEGESDEAPIEDCVTEDFEDNFEDTFTSNNTECTGFFAWDIKQYASVDISSPHPESRSFIVPQLGFGCVSSFKFPMATGGRLQVNLYMMSTSLVDQLFITVFQSIVGGNDITIGRVFHSNMSPEFVPGWQTLNMTVDGPARFDGYVMFQATSGSPNPIIWIDSFRYIGPSSDKDSCVIYEEAPIDCVTEDFENNFEDNFTSNNIDCTGFSAWDIKQYSSVTINSPHANSTRFITPQAGLSCVSSLNFTMTARGTLEVNVYMMAATIHNQLDVSVFQPTVGGTNDFIGGVSLNHQTSDFAPGWQTLNITLGGSGRFQGYVTFVALTQSAEPMTYVDSFRYIGPSTDRDSCVIYQ